jgi:hypothetical protein
MIEFKGSHFERYVILWGVRWYVAYPISYRQLEEMMEERGVEVDHSTLNRWVVKYAPELDRWFRFRNRPVGSSWRLDETYVKIKGFLEISVSGRRQNRRHSGFPIDSQAGSQSGVALSAPSDRSERRSEKDHDRQERRQHGGDRELQRGA